MGGGKVKPQSAKVAAVALFLTPETKQQVCTFPGLAGYYLKQRSKCVPSQV